GVEICLANPGTTEMAWVSALDQVSGLRPVLCLFEGVCTGAADGYGRMKGTPALTLLHLGPGFANGIANLHNARRARTPVVNLIGDHATRHQEADAPLASDIESLAKPVSGWLRGTCTAEAAPADLAEAVAESGGFPGQVCSLIVPADLAEANLRAPRPRPRAHRQPETVPKATIEAAARQWQAVGEPVTILLGGNALSRQGLEAADRIANKTGARLVTETFPARWERGANVPAAERLPYLPEQATEFLGQTARLWLAGARSPVAFFAYPDIPSVIAPEIPRYVLAEPEEDAAQALIDLADALDAQTQRPFAPGVLAPALSSSALDPLQVGHILAHRLPEAAIVVDESATSGLPFSLSSAGAADHTVLTLTGGAIGQGPPCATGAALACPDRTIIDFQADGSALYTFQALWTQAREGLRVITLLCSNRAYRILQVELARAGIAEPGPHARALTSLENPAIDWVSLAQSLGVPGESASTSAEFDAALSRALAAEGPAFIELVL
ncbi:acetolactate synthase large subunit, partial [Myxococcota bacterium]|nr:acetolactate synthase large subunit [Myxococcota bacterium]